jgi:TRAP-type C4-dicarboxylate transport system permease small subunit
VSWADGASAEASPPLSDPNVGAPRALRWVLEAIDWLGRLGGWLAAFCLALLTMLILSEIGLRLLSDFVPRLPAGLRIAWEYSAYLMGTSFMGGAAMTLRAGGHIRVSVLLAQLPPRALRVLEIAVSLLGTGLTGFLAYAMVDFTRGAYERGQTATSSDTPLWIPEAAMTFGAVLLALQMAARLLRATWGLPLEEARLKAAANVE